MKRIGLVIVWDFINSICWMANKSVVKKALKAHEIASVFSPRLRVGVLPNTKGESGNAIAVRKIQLEFYLAESC